LFGARISQIQYYQQHQRSIHFEGFAINDSIDADIFDINILDFLGGASAFSAFSVKIKFLQRIEI
jgi:hypothetical protein